MNTGKVFTHGEDSTNVLPHERVGLGVALSPEDRGMFADQTGYENLLLSTMPIQTKLRQAFGVENQNELPPV